MTLNRIILIAIVLPCLSFQKDNRPKKTTLLNDHLEILNGGVKQLIEIGVGLRGTPFMMTYWDTVSFDKKGKEMEMHSGWSDGSHFISKYNNGNNEVELLYNKNKGKVIYKYGKDGLITEASHGYQSGVYERRFYQYDTNGRVSQVEVYKNASTLHHKILYKYNDKNILLKEDYSPLGKKDSGDKILYEHKSFDEKNNWTTEIRKMKSFKDTLPYLTDTIRRKITYY